MNRYWKFAVAFLTAVAEGGALWADAPHWFVTLLPFVGAALVWLVKNQPATPEAVTTVRGY